MTTIALTLARQPLRRLRLARCRARARSIRSVCASRLAFPLPNQPRQLGQRLSLAKDPRAGNTRSYTVSMSKVMVSIPDDLLARIDREAKRRATSRSALLALAASRELERRDSEEVDQAITRSEKRFRRSGAFDAAELIRNERDSSP